MKMLITLERHHIFSSNFAYLNKFSRHWYAKTVTKGLSRINPAGLGQMFITLESHGIF